MCLWLRHGQMVQAEDFFLDKGFTLDADSTFVDNWRNLIHRTFPQKKTTWFCHWLLNNYSSDWTTPLNSDRTYVAETDAKASIKIVLAKLICSRFSLAYLPRNIFTKCFLSWKMILSHRHASLEKEFAKHWKGLHVLTDVCIRWGKRLWMW